MDNSNIFIASITSISVRLLARITTPPNQLESERKFNAATKCGLKVWVAIKTVNSKKITIKK